MKTVELVSVCDNCAETIVCKPLPGREEQRWSYWFHFLSGVRGCDTQDYKDWRSMYPGQPMLRPKYEGLVAIASTIPITLTEGEDNGKN